MKKLIPVFAFAVFSMISTVTMAASFDDTITFTSVTPVQGEQLQQQQVCSQVEMQSTVTQDRSSVGSILGGLAGALLGSRVGNGNGRTAATAAAAIAGAVTGDRLDNRQQIQATSQQQTCRLVTTSVPKIIGYLVSFEYGGRSLQQMLPFDPSQGGTHSLRVSISIQPK